ncbi:MAG: hypothetical protein ACO1OF_16515 [Adhaeribacter sp.]
MSLILLAVKCQKVVVGTPIGFEWPLYSFEYRYNTDTDQVEEKKFPNNFCTVSKTQTVTPIHVIQASGGYYNVYFNGDKGVRKEWVPLVPEETEPVVPLTVTLEIIHESAPGAKDGQVKIVATGGKPGYLYTLDTFLPPASPFDYVLNLAPGNYTASVKDAAGTIVRKEFTILAAEADPLVVAPVLNPLQDLYFSQNPVTIGLAGTGANKTIILETYLERGHLSGNFLKVTEQERDTDAAGQAQFNIAGSLDAILQSQPDELPAPNTTRLFRTVNNLGRFYVIARERGADGQPGHATQSGYSTVIMGGLPKHLSGPAFFSGLHTNNRRFFTWQPPSKEISLHLPEYFYFLITQKNLTQVTALYTWYKADGSEFYGSSQWIDLVEHTGQYRMIGIPFNGQYLEEEAHSVKLEIVDVNGNVISNAHYLKLRRNHVGTLRTFLFRNSLGTWDTLYCTGQQSSKLEVIKSEAELYDGTKQLFTVDGTRLQKISTGWINRAQLHYLQELLLSKKVVELVEGRYVPLLIRTKEINYEADYSGPNGFTFEYAYGEEINHYAL